MIREEDGASANVVGVAPCMASSGGHPPDFNFGWLLVSIQAQGQSLAVHLDWMRSRGWSKAWVILPHDGAHGDKAGFDVLVIPN